jgi:hypothetical protein
MQLTLSTIILTREQFDQLHDFKRDYDLYLDDDGTLNMTCFDDDDCLDPAFLEKLSEVKATGQLHFFQGPSNYGRCDYGEFGYDFEDGILSNLEAVVTWRKVAPPK